jgi:hypothetical protein
VAVDPTAEVLHQHLRAEADAEKRRPFFQGNADPVGFLPDEIVRVVGAHRPAENHRSSMLFHRGGQRIAEAGPADVQLETLLPQHLPELAGAGGFLVQDDQDLRFTGQGGHGRGS